MMKTFMAAVAPVLDEKYSTEIEKARRDLRALISDKKCAPIMLRLAWDDAGTYDAIRKTGGPNGSIKNMHAANTDLKTAIDLCEEVKAKHPRVTYADLYQLAGVVAVELTGGPTIDFAPGRKDSNKSPYEELLLPDANQCPSDIKDVLYRIGLSNKDIVALSGAHMTLGKAHLESSGFVENPFKFDNSYFVELLKGGPTDDKAILADPNFRSYVELYAKDEEAYLKDYAESHKKLSELGLDPIPVSQKASIKARGWVQIAVICTLIILCYVNLLIKYIYEINRKCKD